MLDRLRRLLRRPAARAATADLPTIPRDHIAHLLVTDEGLPHLDWGMAAAWIDHREPTEPGRERLRRAVAAAWLDELRDALTTDSRRWRRADPPVEGLAPLAGTTGARLAEWADRSLKVVGDALTPIRGDGPIPPVAVVGLATRDEYYAFVSRFYHDEGEYATSGGLYIRGDADAFPLLVVNAQTKWDLESVVAHELTHHALRGLDLPLWAEEGLTQMMEERVTGSTDFVLDRRVLERHRELWDRIGLDGFADGSTFGSPEGEEQELSYHLAEAIVRSALSVRPKPFFAFARACAGPAADPDRAAEQHLGATAQDLAAALVWGESR